MVYLRALISSRYGQLNLVHGTETKNKEKLKSKTGYSVAQNKRSRQERERVTVIHCQSKEASILWSHHEKTRELPNSVKK